MGPAKQAQFDACLRKGTRNPHHDIFSAISAGDSLVSPLLPARMGGRMRILNRVVFLVLVLGTPPAVFAQDEQQALPRPKRDFLFGEPRGWVAVRGTWLVPRAGGDLFGFVSDQLTVDAGDLQTPAFTTEIGFEVAPRISISGAYEYSAQKIGSEYRHFIDNLGMPITQTTKLVQTNIGVSVRLWLVEPGQSISRLAYLPRTFLPYVGGGGGLMYYELRQIGDFVDATTLHVFFDDFHSQGWTPSVHVFAGSDIRVWRGIFLDVEGRYIFAHGGLDSDFVGFDGIDLAGLRLSTGVHVSF